LLLRLLEGTTSEDTKIRRIRLPQIVDNQGNVSFEILLSLVTKFNSLDHHESIDTDKCIKLKYHDIDSDLIDLISTDDLLDAVDQYLKNGFLRVFAKVEKRPKQEFQQEPKPSGGKNPPVSCTNNESSKKSPPNIDELLGAVVGAAVDAFQKDFLHIKAPVHIEDVSLTEAIQRSLQEFTKEEEKKKSDQEEGKIVKKDAEVYASVMTLGGKSTDGCNQGIACEKQNFKENIEKESKDDAKKKTIDEFDKPEKQQKQQVKALQVVLGQNEKEQGISAKEATASLPIAGLKESTTNKHSASVKSIPSLQPAQQDRWAFQLQKLKELGFDDEVRYVEILERLTAANIGVGSSDEVTVAQVLHHLFK